MDSDKLPTEFDAIILGTGVCESIVAAALSRIGWRVLHLDRYDNYGGDWASYNFSALQQWIQTHTTQRDNTEPTPIGLESLLNSSEQLILLPTQSATVTNVVETKFVDESPDEASSLDGSLFNADAKRFDGKREEDTSASTVGISRDQTVPEGDVVPVQQAASGSESVESTGDTVETTNNQAEAGSGNNTAEIVDQSQAVAASTEPSTTATDVQPDTGQSLAAKYWNMTDIKRQWRKFNIDLMPKLLYCRGSLVELLISSDVAKYCEFRSVSRVLTCIDGKLEQVPCSRADVFASHSVGVIEKRMLMKLLTFCLEFDKNPSEFAGFEDRPFVEFLKSKKLTDTVRHYVQHAIAMVTDSSTTLEGLRSTQKFLQSLGRYGNTAFLWPLYGSGELPQCFCRMCAVFGGIYCLRRQATAAILDSDNKLCAVIESQGQRLATKWLVMEASYASAEILPATTLPRISRAVLLTNCSIKSDKQKHITLLSLALPGSTDVCATVYELSSDSLACPDGLYVVHMTCLSVGVDAKTDLEPIVDKLFQSANKAETDVDDSKPRVLWSLYFNVDNSSRRSMTSSVDNVLVVAGPDEYIDYDYAVAEARQIFERMCPGEEFLPKAPNPEDIIYDDGETGGQRETGFESTGQGDGGAAVETPATVESLSAAVEQQLSTVEQLSTDATPAAEEKPVVDSAGT